MESLKIIEEIVSKQRHDLDKPNQAAILIMDVFRGPMIEEVISLLSTNNIWLVKVPNNMTHLFQPFYLMLMANVRPT